MALCQIMASAINMIRLVQQTSLIWSVDVSFSHRAILPMTVSTERMESKLVRLSPSLAVRRNAIFPSKALNYYKPFLIFFPSGPNKISALDFWNV